MRLGVYLGEVVKRGNTVPVQNNELIDIVLL